VRGYAHTHTHTYTQSITYAHTQQSTQPRSHTPAHTNVMHVQHSAQLGAHILILKLLYMYTTILLPLTPYNLYTTILLLLYSLQSIYYHTSTTILLTIYIILYSFIHTHLYVYNIARNRELTSLVCSLHPQNPPPPPLPTSAPPFSHPFISQTKGWSIASEALSLFLFLFFFDRPLSGRSHPKHSLAAQAAGNHSQKSVYSEGNASDGAIGQPVVKSEI
jgi:hypothetical protein